MPAAPALAPHSGARPVANPRASIATSEQKLR